MSPILTGVESTPVDLGIELEIGGEIVLEIDGEIDEEVDAAVDAGCFGAVSEKTKNGIEIENRKLNINLF